MNKSTLFDTTLVEESLGGGGYYAHVMTMKSLRSVKNPREKMKILETPVLLLRGQYDNQKWGYTEEYLKLLRNASIKIIPRSGHFIHLEQSELYYQEIYNFLRTEDQW